MHDIRSEYSGLVAMNSLDRGARAVIHVSTITTLDWCQDGIVGMLAVAATPPAGSAVR